MSYERKYIEVEQYLYELHKHGIELEITYTKKYDKKFYTVKVNGEEIARNIEFRCLYAMLRLAHLLLVGTT